MTRDRQPDRGSARTLLLDLAAPIALYYGLRSAGASVYVALLAGAAPPALNAAISVTRQRRVDRLGAVVLIMLAVSTGISAIGGSPRFLLAKDGLITAAWGAWMLASLLAARPLTFLFSRPLLEGRNPHRRGATPTGPSWDVLFEQRSAFRRVWRVTTVIWGAAMLIDAAVRIIMSYTLPVDLVPALGGALWPVTFLVLQVSTNVYFHRAGFWQMVRGEPHHEATKP
jgi:hypothetical protein